VVGYLADTHKILLDELVRDELTFWVDLKLFAGE
jgi:hypothetical protein